jgi:hypothetical protein
LDTIQYHGLTLKTDKEVYTCTRQQGACGMPLRRADVPNSDKR